MFTWICPKCGREVPPAYTECPDCSGQTAQGGANPQAVNPPGAVESSAPPDPSQGPSGPARRRPVWSDAPAQTAPPPPPPYTAPEPPPIAPHPAEPAYTPPFSAVAPPPLAKRRLPTWLLTILFALIFAGAVFGVYSLVNRTPTKPTAVVESPAAKPGAPANPIQRYVEISGVRFLDDPKHKDRLLVRFVVTSHAETADLSGLSGNVTLWGSTRRSEEDAFGTFSFKTDLKPSESKELTEPLTTKKKAYEMPDWQNLTTDVQITGPTG
ncbi:MAG TPA: hypothetical protein VKB88_27310 [Bryobacteraceae bacterium]|nr:hypothetical protein [Bryobacteraceae bacterium]